jgi:hypothetical protein
MLQLMVQVFRDSEISFTIRYVIYQSLDFQLHLCRTSIQSPTPQDEGYHQHLALELSLLCQRFMLQS